MAMGRDRPFLDRCEMAKAVGFSGIEFLPYDFEKAALCERLRVILHSAPEQPMERAALLQKPGQTICSYAFPLAQ